MKRLNEKVNYNYNVIKRQRFEETTKLNASFYNVSCSDLATSLLGKILVRKIDSTIFKGRIVETECYPGGIDKASHSFNGRRTNCNEPMYMEAGTVYVYKIFGIYSCFNISSVESGGAVLIRALEPIAETENMQLNRQTRNPAIKPRKDKELCNGPSKLCISLSIEKESCNKENLTTSTIMWLEDDHFYDFNIITSTRIGIESCGEEASSKLLRFYVFNSPCVSKRDRIREKLYLDLNQ